MFTNEHIQSKERNRLFVGISFNEMYLLKEIQQNILKQIHISAQKHGIELIPTKQLHLTLYFLGSIDTKKLPQAILNVEEVASSFRHTYSTKAFDNYHSRINADILMHPGADHGAIALLLEEHPLLRVLHKDLLTIFAPDMPSEHTFLPHITVARIKLKHTDPLAPAYIQQIQLELQSINESYRNEKACLSIQHIELFESHNGIHTSLARFEI